MSEFEKRYPKPKEINAQNLWLAAKDSWITAFKLARKLVKTDNPTIISTESLVKEIEELENEQ